MKWVAHTYMLAAKNRYRGELVERGVLFLTGEITERVVQELTEQLFWVAVKNIQPVTLFINTEGGDIHPALSLYDTITFLNALGLEVNTCAVGSCFSAGVVVLQAGRYRYISPNTYLLIHEVSSWSWGSVSEHEDWARHLKEIQSRVFRLLASRSNLSSRSLWQRARRKDWVLTAEEALRWKLVDSLWQPHILNLNLEQLVEK